MDLGKSGVVPRLAATPIEALELLRRDGAVIVDGVDPGSEDARGVARDVFGPAIRALPPAARVFDGGEMDRRLPGVDHRARLAAHTDGYAYGDLYPDYFLLSCVRASPAGGESFLVDGYAVLDAMRADAELHWVPDALVQVAIDQTETGMQHAVSPIVQRAPDGRVMVRKTFDQKPAADSPDKARAQAMIDAWHQAAERVAEQAPRFKLAPGQAVVVDNYRMLHGRDAYTDPSRLLWRVWVWTSGSLGVPDMPLHSDTRHAAAAT
jgi:gamma-butyrobetaine dioxygenase